MTRAIEWKRAFFGSARSPYPGRTAVYQLYPARGGHLYIGISNSPARRFEQHAETKHWWPSVDHGRTTITWYATRKQALRVERRLIRRHQPVHNVQHNPRRGDLRPRFGQEGWVLPWKVRWIGVSTVAAAVSAGGVLEWWPLPGWGFLAAGGTAGLAAFISTKVR